ncbi:ParB/RepB/Spo0J family partition protein [Xenophilus azovorans]
MAAFDATDRDVVVEVDGEVVPVEQGQERSIPLNSLFLSERNVRKVRNTETIPALAATIEAQGLLYRLCVVPEKRKGTKGETFGVVAGGRRLAALHWLVKQGRMAKDAPVQCLVFDVSRGVAVSLTENFAQEVMHPADQMVAFKKLVDEGKTAGQVAAAFGVSVLTVERRLALANLAPMFIDLYREGKIEQGQLQALALTSDHERQQAVWESLPQYSRSAYSIRAALTKEEIKASEPLAVFVGLDKYREAGGTLREDLFSESDAVFLQDGALLNRLAAERLEAEATALEEAGWKWAEVRMHFTSADRSHFARLHCESAKPSKQEAAAMDDLQASINRLNERLDELEALTAYDSETDEEGVWTDEQQAEHDSLEEQAEQLVDQLSAMQDVLRVWKPEQKATAGVVLSIDSDGTLCVTEGLVRPEDRKAIVAAAKNGDEGAAAAAEALSASSPAPKERAEYSAALCQNMTAHRTAAVAASLSQNPVSALAALLHTLILRERQPWQSSPLDVRFADNTHHVERNAADFDGTKAAGVLKEADALLASLPGESSDLFAHLLAMAVPDLLSLLARSVARAYSVQSPDPVRKHPRGGFDLAQGIESALGVDMADWWYPSIENYLGHVPKSKMVEAVTECVGAQAAQPIEKMKKADAIAATASLLDGRRWLPSTLQPYPMPVLREEFEEDGQEEDEDEQG